MDKLSFVALIAAGGAIGAFWGQIRGFFERCCSYLIVSFTVDDYHVAKAMSGYFFENLKRSPIGPRNYSSIQAFVRPMNRAERVGTEKIGKSSVLFWRGFRPIWVKTTGDWDTYPLNVQFIRGMFDCDKLVIAAIENLNANNRALEHEEKKAEKRFCVRHIVGKDFFFEKNKTSGATFEGIHYKHLRILKWRHGELGLKESLFATVNHLALSQETLEAIEEARFWKKSEKWYADRGIPWKRGWLLWGKPGTGKTSLARAIAEELDLPVFVYDLSSLNNEDMRSHWTDMMEHTPCMAVLEDIDSIFCGRKNISQDGKLRSMLTFDCLLNCIDGIEKTDGLFTVITTNKLKKLDPAIGGGYRSKVSPRPGRVDRVIECGPPDRQGLEKICRRILKHEPELWEKVVADGVKNHDTAAQFQERCSNSALRLLWAKQKEADNVLDMPLEEAIAEIERIKSEQRIAV